MSELPKDFPFFHVGDVVQHKQSKRVGEVVRFAFVPILAPIIGLREPAGPCGTYSDIWLCEPGTRVCGHGDNETGPYKQTDFVKLEKKK